MIKNKHILIIFLVLSVLKTQAQDTFNLSKVMYENQKQQYAFLNHLYLCPSQIIYSNQPAISLFNISLSQRENEDVIDLNQGLSAQKMRIMVNTYNHISENEIFYGKAHYINKKIEQINWNTTSDYNRLYPYIMSDTVGGDLNSEEYFFEAGYAKKISKWTSGISLSYRGLLDYRPADPRPKNTVADLTLKCGTSYRIIPTYTLGVDVEINKYKQSNSIKFFSELGATPLFHIIGTGIDYSRFYGDKFNTQYQGNYINGSISLLKVKEKGLSVIMGYQKSKYTKIIHELNNLPMANLNEQEFNLTIGYQKKYQIFTFGIKTIGEIKHRKGTENIFGDAVNNEYPKIAEITPFYLDDKNLTVNTMIEGYIGQHWTISLNSKAKYNSFNEQYLYPNRQLKCKSFIYQNKLTSIYRKGKNNITISVNMAKKQTKNRRLLLDNYSKKQTLYPLIENRKKIYFTDFNLYQLHALWQYSFNNRYALLLGANYYYKVYSNSINQQIIEFNIGLIL